MCALQRECAYVCTFKQECDVCTFKRECDVCTFKRECVMCAQCALQQECVMWEKRGKKLHVCRSNDGVRKKKKVT